MDAETLQTFLEEAESYLPTMRAGIMAYERDASLLAELQAVRRQAHSVKGAALMMDLAEIGQLAEEMEGDLKKIIHSKSALSEQAAGEFLSRILVLEAYLKNLRKALNRASSAQADSGPQPAANFAGRADAGAGCGGDFPQQAQEVSPTGGGPAAGGAAAEEFEIDADMLAVFAEEAEDLLRVITEHLGVLEKAPDSRGALLEIRRSAHTLKGSAGIVGLKNLSALAHRVEDLLDYLAENDIKGGPQVFELLLAATDCLSALARGENSAETKQKTAWLYQTCDGLIARMKAAGKNSALGAAYVKTAAPQTEVPAETDPPAAHAAPEEPAAIQTDALSAADAEALTVESQTPGPANSQQPQQQQPRAVIRVSLDRINELANLVGEMVISRSVFEQRLGELERQVAELHHATQRLRSSTGRLETDFETISWPAPGAESRTSPVAFPPAPSPAATFGPAGGGGGEFDALEFDRYTEFHQTTRELVETASDASAINSGLDNLMDNMRLLFDSQRYLIEEMQDNLLRLRMVSLDTLTPRLQRTVRVTANEEGKLAELIVENERLEIDTEILDAFVEPLIHLLRNAVAHGIEPAETRRLLGKPERGRITLRAHSEGTHVVFTVADDGRGIDVSALKKKAAETGFISPREFSAMADEAAYSLVFLPGLSTCREITQVSGRGVGMNIVSSAVSRRQGSISVKSEPQKGTTFTVRLPVSMAVTRALLAKAEKQTLALPLKLVRRAAEIPREDADAAGREGVLRFEGASYSFFHFNELVGLPPPAPAKAAAVPVALIETLEKPFALAFEQILKTEEIVIKPLSAPLTSLPELTGATVLGDGSVVPVLDLVYLLRRREGEREKGRRGEGEKGENAASQLRATAAPPPRVLSVLIVDDSPSVRQVNMNLIKNAGWQALVAKDGLEALEILQSLSEPPLALPDVVLTDVEMPRMDGYELLATLRRHPAAGRLPVIMITSRAGEKHRRKAFDLGVNEYLSKPYDEKTLLEKIRNLISG